MHRIHDHVPALCLKLKVVRKVLVNFWDRFSMQWITIYNRPMGFWINAFHALWRSLSFKEKGWSQPFLTWGSLYIHLLLSCTKSFLYECRQEKPGDLCGVMPWQQRITQCNDWQYNRPPTASLRLGLISLSVRTFLVRTLFSSRNT
jgi:hypothetical protein